MEYLVKQISDRFQNEIVKGGRQTSMFIESIESIGEHFWLNDTNDSFSGMYEIIGVVS